MLISCFFFNDTATTEIYTLSLHDALPISKPEGRAKRRGLAEIEHDLDRARARAPHRHDRAFEQAAEVGGGKVAGDASDPDRKSTRLNSSHTVISYAVFCLI